MPSASSDVVSVFWARFETPVLLQVCESLLVERVDDSSVFQLLEVAELYHARHLRVSLRPFLCACST